jgi:hypothetical protein
MAYRLLEVVHPKIRVNGLPKDPENLPGGRGNCPNDLDNCPRRRIDPPGFGSGLPGKRSDPPNPGIDYPDDRENCPGDWEDFRSWGSIFPITGKITLTMGEIFPAAR